MEYVVFAVVMLVLIVILMLKGLYDYKESEKRFIKKLYDEVAVKNLEYSLELARHIFKFAPDDYKIQRLKDSYYK